ncbi:MAG: Na(+)-translocating NADH-quinone reductase subunit C, partial [Aeromonas sp.]
MAFNKDSTLGTISVVTALSLVCSIVVSVAAVGLRSTQLENKAIDRQSNILAVAGVNVVDVPKRDLAKLYADKIDARLIDLTTGNFVEGDANNFDTKLA